MLQRWQSVFLFLAAVAMIVFIFMPVMAINGNHIVSALGQGDVMQPNFLLLTLDVLIVAMSFITIFKYGNLKSQHRMCKINVLLIVALLLAIGVLWLMQRGQAIAVLSPWIVLPFVALFFTLWASGRVKADRKLLSDSERIR